MQTNVTRRSAIGSLAVAATVLPLPVRASPRASDKMQSLIAAAKEAGLRVAGHHDRVYQPAFDRMTAAVNEARRALPHLTVAVADKRDGGLTDWSTDNPVKMALARSIVGLAERGRSFDVEHVAAMRRLVAAADARDEAIERVAGRFGVRDLARENNALSDAHVTARNDVAVCPAVTVADLHAKLTFMIDSDMDGEGWLPNLLADASRVAGLEC